MSDYATLEALEEPEPEPEQEGEDERLSDGFDLLMAAYA